MADTVFQIVEPEPEFFEVSASARSAEQRDQMDEKQPGKRPARDAVDQAANVAAIFQDLEGPTEKRIGILVGEAGIHENDEQDHHAQVLVPDPLGHAYFAASRLPDFPDVPPRLGDVVQRVEHKHAANRQHDDDGVT